MTDSTVATLAHHALLEHLAPAAVVVSPQGQIVHVFGAMDRYIHLPTGEATLDILSLARQPLKPALRAAFHDAVRRNRETVLETIRSTAWQPPNEPSHHGSAARRSEGRRASVADDLRGTTCRRLVPRHHGRSARCKTIERRLEAELRATKREQQHLVAQLEHSNDELKVANEEVRSMNEELQSTNEELVTSKEELQSMNEELTTLNSQLQEKVQEVSAVNDDLANLLVSTDIATVFVDKELRIKRFTNAASQLLNLRPSDTGCPITHIATTVGNVDLSRDARAVLKNQRPIEKEVTAQGGKHYIVRVLPYRSGDVVQGVVMTLSDVTALKNAEAALIAAREQVSADLRRMTRLHEVSTRLASQEDLTSLLNEILARRDRDHERRDGHHSSRGRDGRLDDRGAERLRAAVPGFLPARRRRHRPRLWHGADQPPARDRR